MNWKPRDRGPMDHMHNASYSNKLNNSVEAEASPIQLESEDHFGKVGTLATMALAPPLNSREIAIHRFEDQQLPPPDWGKTKPTAKALTK